MRYFFHVSNNGDVYIDEVGRRFTNSKNAIAHAKVIASELAIEAENYQGYVVCVVDDEGKDVVRVPIVKD